MKSRSFIRLAPAVGLSCLFLGWAAPCGLRAQTVAPAAPVAPSQDAALPSAKKVIERFVKEIGGEAAYSKIASQHAKGKLEMVGQGISGQLEVFAKRPDRMLLRVNLPGLGEMLEGYDGKVGWSVNPLTGPMVLEGKMLEQHREQARFDSTLHPEDEFRSMETIRRTEFEGKACYELKLVRKNGQEVTEYYDIQSGLLIGFNQTQETPLGAVNTTALASDYQRFGDVLFATKMTQKLGPLTQVMTFTNIEFNNVDDSVFALPNEIKALVKP